MGMFDSYRPTERLRCPVDGNPLLEWQGKDGPCLLLVWQEGTKHPVDHRVDEEVRLSTLDLKSFTLPSRFVIYSFDCPVHQPVFAACATRDGIWTSTELRPSAVTRSEALEE